MEYTVSRNFFLLIAYIFISCILFSIFTHCRDICLIFFVLKYFCGISMYSPKIICIQITLCPFILQVLRAHSEHSVYSGSHCCSKRNILSRTWDCGFVENNLSVVWEDLIDLMPCVFRSRSFNPSDFAQNFIEVYLLRRFNYP
jgi:hypothetical protein